LRLDDFGLGHHSMDKCPDHAIAVIKGIPA